MSANRYCEHLGIAVPCLDDIVAGDRRAKLFHLMVIAILEHGGPMTIAQIAERLQAAGFRYHWGDLELSLKRAWHGSPPVHKLSDGTFDIDLQSHDLSRILLVLDAQQREEAAIRLDAQQREEAAIRREKSFDNWLAQRRDEAAKLRRALVHGFQDSAHAGAVTILDMANHTLCTLSGDAMAEAGHFLSQYDLIAGYRVLDTLRQLNLEPGRWTLIDLAGHQKSVTINRQGRQLKLTTEMLMRASIGLSRPLGDAAKKSRYIANTQMTRLIRRIESEAKALHALYRYGVLHRYLRLRWGFLNEILPVHWGLPGDLMLDDILKRAAEAGLPVDLVAGNAPGWTDPWARAQRGYVAALSDWEIMLVWENRRWIVDRYEVQAVRIVGEETDD